MITARLLNSWRMRLGLVFQTFCLFTYMSSRQRTLSEKKFKSYLEFEAYEVKYLVSIENFLPSSAEPIGYYIDED